MIDVKNIIRSLRTNPKIPSPVLFDNIKRSFLLLGRMLKSSHTQGTFTYSTIIKMMSSRRRATKEETLEWLEMLVRENVLKRNKKMERNAGRTFYYELTENAFYIQKDMVFGSLILN